MKILIVLDESDIIKKYKAGMSTKRISEENKCNAETIRRILIKNNIPRRTRSELWRGSSNPMWNSKRFGNKNPNYKRKHTEEECIKMSENHYDCSGNKNPNYGKRGKDSHNYGIKRSEEFKTKISATRIKKKLSAGKRNPNYGKPPKHSRRVEYNGIKFRSTWESKYAKYLDANSVEWIYEKLHFPITYLHMGLEKEGTYTPDFYLIREDKFVEVKGWWWRGSKEKYNAFISQYPELGIILLMKKELKELGVL